jgi:glycosyltransferase involved in cell wall biosynthesis
LARPAAASVVLTGWLNETHRAACLARAQVLAYPSFDEGFGLPMLEAMRVGVPVVAANAGAIPEVVGDAALLVDPNDVPALAIALQRAITESTVRTALIAAGHGRVDQYSWHRCAVGLADMYNVAATEQRRETSAMRSRSKMTKKLTK